MPALPHVLTSRAARGLADVSHVLARREVDHRVLEALAVIATICISMGLLLYWGIKKQGSWKCGGDRKK